MATTPNNIHDMTFQSLMQNPAFAVELFKSHLPAEICQQIDWDSLEIDSLSTRHVQKNLRREYYSDLVYKVKIRGEDSFILLHGEHQSTPQWILPVRSVNYVASKLLEFHEKDPRKKLPRLLTFVYYHGSPTPYPHSLHWLDCFEDREFAEKYTQTPFLIDLGAISDKTLKAGAPAIAGPQMAFKHIFSKDFTPYQTAVFKLLQNAPCEIRRTTLHYLISRAIINLEHFVEESYRYLPEEKETVMKFYQDQQRKWFTEGAAEGKAEGKAEGITEGIAKGKAEGRYQEQVRMARELLSLGERDLGSIARLSQLGVDQIEALNPQTAETEA